MLLLASLVGAEPTSPSTFWTRPEAPFSVQGELTTVALMGSLGTSASWRPVRGLAVSLGGGAGYLLSVYGEPYTAVGGQVMAHALFGGDVHSFEVAGGVGAIWDVGLLPAAFVGYRRHPLAGGFVFRIGGGWNYYYGVGLDVSFGYGF